MQGRFANRPYPGPHRGKVPCRFERRQEWAGGRIILDLTESPEFTNIRYHKKEEDDMKILLGGIVALVIGVIGLVVWWFEFLRVLKGVVPIILVLGGALAIYLGIEDVKTTSASPTPEEKPAEKKE